MSLKVINNLQEAKRQRDEIEDGTRPQKDGDRAWELEAMKKALPLMSEQLRRQTGVEISKRAFEKLEELRDSRDTRKLLEELRLVAKILPESSEAQSLERLATMLDTVITEIASQLNAATSIAPDYQSEEDNTPNSIANEITLNGWYTSEFSSIYQAILDDIDQTLQKVG